MKKLVVLLVAAVAACVVNAATASWSMSNVLSPVEGTAASGYSAYLFSYLASDTATYGSVTGALADGNLSVLSSATATGTISSGKISASGAGSFAASTAYTAFAVVFDGADPASAGNYMITKEVSKTVAATGANISFGFGTQAATTWNKMAGGGDGTPEPTSGLLLLVGGAMLALRRKQK